ncbi:hypothetical protein BDEG_25530 [Batrachochytrium dendrobatidis JEL423]|uniref:Protein kinase domain-containing protein n=1 Tax=Batrachochytrium dendrobatidis (strain JEL423) TaxID=403673 RepID=A0A177WRI2_BATDL|nr:hypothetical protein BDEG_25530 [Batrachochytrium dendrobatidis JEL423]
MASVTVPITTPIEETHLGGLTHVRNYSITHAPPSTPLRLELSGKVPYTLRSRPPTATKHSRRSTENLEEVDEGYGSMPLINEARKVLLEFEEQNSDGSSSEVPLLESGKSAAISTTTNQHDEVTTLEATEVKPKPFRVVVIRPRQVSAFSAKSEKHDAKLASDGQSPTTTIEKSKKVQSVTPPDTHMIMLKEEESQPSVLYEQVDRVASIDFDNKLVLDDDVSNAQQPSTPSDLLTKKSLEKHGSFFEAAPLRKWAPVSDLYDAVDLGSAFSENSLEDIGHECDRFADIDAEISPSSNQLGSQYSLEHEIDLSSWQSKNKLLDKYLKNNDSMPSPIEESTSKADILNSNNLQPENHANHKRDDPILLVFDEPVIDALHPESNLLQSQSIAVEISSTRQDSNKQADALFSADDTASSIKKLPTSDAEGHPSFINVHIHKKPDNLHPLPSRAMSGSNFESTLAVRSSSFHVGTIMPQQRSMYQMKKLKQSLPTLDDEEEPDVKPSNLSKSNTAHIIESKSMTESISSHESVSDDLSSVEDLKKEESFNSTSSAIESIVKSDSMCANSSKIIPKDGIRLKKPGLHMPDIIKKMIPAKIFKADKEPGINSRSNSTSSISSGKFAFFKGLSGFNIRSRDNSTEDIRQLNLITGKIQLPVNTEKIKMQQKLHENLVKEFMSEPHEAPLIRLEKYSQQKATFPIHRGAVNPTKSIASSKGSSCKSKIHSLQSSDTSKSSIQKSGSMTSTSSQSSTSTSERESMQKQNIAIATKNNVKGAHTGSMNTHIIDNTPPSIKAVEDLAILEEFSTKEKYRFESSYKLIKQIGSGGHSTVWLSTRNSDGRMVVCKFINASSVWNWHVEESGFPTNRRASLVDTVSNSLKPKLASISLISNNSRKIFGNGNKTSHSTSGSETCLDQTPDVTAFASSMPSLEITDHTTFTPKDIAMSKLTALIKKTSKTSQPIKVVPVRKIPLEIHKMRHFAGQNQPRLVKYYDHFEMYPRYVIVMEYLGQEWVDLYDYIEMYGPVKESHACMIFKQIVETVACMHRMGFCHNDIKDENIMIHTKTREIKLIDFGSTTYLKPEVPTKIFYGTKKFAAPEALDGGDYYPACQETWALGTLLYVLLFQMDPFKDDDEVMELNITHRIERLRAPVEPGSSRAKQGHVPIVVSDEAVDLLSALMQKDYRNRPKISEIIDFDFFHQE